MKKIIYSILTMFVVTITANAQGHVKIDGLYYVLSTSAPYTATLEHGCAHDQNYRDENWGANNRYKAEFSNGTELVVPYEVTVSGITYKVKFENRENLFRSIPQITKVYVDAEIVPDYTFSGLSNCTEIVIGEHVKSIARNALRDCGNNLTKVVIKSSLEDCTIFQDLVQNNNGLLEFSFESNPLPKLDEWFVNAFQNNNQIQISIPEGVTPSGSGWSKLVNSGKLWEVDEDGNKTKIETPRQNQSKNFNRTFTQSAIDNKQWQALYQEWTMDYNDWKDYMDIAKIVSLHRYDNDFDGITDEWFLEVEVITSGSLKANTPYVVRGKRQNCNFQVNNSTEYSKQAKTITCWSTEAKYSFTGTYKDTKNLFGKYTVSGGEIKRIANNEATLKADRWYLTIDEIDNQMYNGMSVSPSRIRILTKDSFNSEDDMTAIGDNFNKDKVVTDIFTLEGKQMSKFVKGLNIIRFDDGSIVKRFVK